MSKLKQRIKDAEDEVIANRLLIDEEFAELKSHPRSPILIGLILLGGLISGFFMGKFKKATSPKSLLRLPFTLSKMMSVVKSLSSFI